MTYQGGNIYLLDFNDGKVSVFFYLPEKTSVQHLKSRRMHETVIQEKYWTSKIIFKRKNGRKEKKVAQIEITAFHVLKNWKRI